MHGQRVTMTCLACALSLLFGPACANGNDDAPRVEPFHVKAGSDVVDVLRMEWTEFDLLLPAPGGLPLANAEIGGLKGTVKAHPSAGHPGVRVEVWSLKREGPPCRELFPRLSNTLVEAFGPAQVTSSESWPAGFLEWTGEVSLVAYCWEFQGLKDGRRFVGVSASRYHPDKARLKAKSWEDFVRTDDGSGMTVDVLW